MPAWRLVYKSWKDDKIVAEVEVPTKAEFMVDNPGQQSHTGSFQPLRMTWEEWASPHVKEEPKVEVLPKVEKEKEKDDE